MEYKPEKCKRKHRKHVTFFKDLFHVSSQSSLSSNSECHSHPLKLLSRKCRRKKEPVQNYKKSDNLARLLERKKLKEKSLSKKMKTPFDRKLNRTCWPIQLSKVSKIKKRPQEKRKKKPNYRSLTRKKFSNPTFVSKTRDVRESSSTSISDSENDEGSLREIYEYYQKSHFYYEPVTPQMLMDVLQDPEHLNSGATIDMIIGKLRTRKLDLNPSLDLLREEVIQKLDCAIKLGMVKEKNGYYSIADNFRKSRLPRQQLDAFWELWNRKITQIKK